ncbi:grasp-with-spasm system SPASM domain peptide maturase [Chryseobacterium daecheongense]|uniref:grasp-with-spasm system SPASM domain peptide maturase n=1 Tax=Chryseobacterium daecheongense TaxID=192389 RepID=UPI001FD70F88|nr:grasp-with-spasm system SPASM domain peptide maturase [Chryseobacterium daecheongense]UOU97261.1 grasp-with-spasm system SPASM domain peptide maturase [Chryseobacterium daecheongense]
MNQLLLYSHCIIVNGATRSLICDLQRKNMYPIPNAFAALFNDGRYIDIPEILSQLDEESKEIFKEYTDFLEENELAFHCSANELQLFPKMSEEWLFPAHISHCVLDAWNEVPYFDGSFLKQLEVLCCNFIQFRFFKKVSWPELDRIMALINPSQIKSIEIILPADEEDDVFYKKAEFFVAENRKISSLTISGAPETKIHKEGLYGMGFILLTETHINHQHHCGIIDNSLFSIHISTYTESLAHNSCLNRKISIDTEGNIKNCPSMKESYGNISNTSLEEALQKQGFKKYWNITKDQITKCKDCEFRYVCTDCRAYLDDPDNPYSAPLKCGYNPYTCEWEEWSTHPLKQNAINHYHFEEPAKDYN